MQPAYIKNPVNSEVPSDNGQEVDSPLDQVVNRIYEPDVVMQIAEKNDLSAYIVMLTTTVKNAAKLYLSYSPRRARSAHDLAPKCRTVAKIAEMARNLNKELRDLDFWDRWQVYRQLESTGHPLVDNLEGYNKGDPVIAGNIMVEEVQLILTAFERYESDFFAALTAEPGRNSDIGLYFFMYVMAGFWESVRGESLIDLGTLSDPRPEALTFLQDCIAPLDVIDSEAILAVLQG